MTENNADQGAAESAVQMAAIAGESFSYMFFFFFLKSSQLAASSRVEGADEGIGKVRK